MATAMESCVRTVFILILVFGAAVSASFYTQESSAHVRSTRSDVLMALTRGLLARGLRPQQRPVVKRGGMGQCIFDCMQSGGGLTFIQCKTMCYW